MRVCQRQRRHLCKSLRDWLSVPPFTRAFLKSPSSRGLSAIAELLVIILGHTSWSAVKSKIKKVTGWGNRRSTSRYISNFILVKLAQIFTKILYSSCCDLDLWPEKLTRTSTNPHTSVTKIGWNTLHWFLRYDVHKAFGMHRLMHSLIQTDRPEHRLPVTPEA